MINLNKVSDKLKSDFYLFFEMFWDKISGDEYVESGHIKFICKELQELGEKVIKREKPDFDWYIFNVPPGSSKSSIASIMWPTWLITNDPSLFVINTSYSYDLAVGFIRKSKLILNSNEYRAIFGKLDLIKDLEYHFETRQQGGRYATSTGGTVTGAHGNVLISDDPVSVEESYSKTKLLKANRYQTQTLPTRKRNKNIVPQVIIMQRLNENDPTGHILGKGLKIKHICLPAELSKRSTNPELYTDGLLDPVRMNMEVLDNFKKVLGGYGYAGQFEQSPSPDEGGKIKRAWFEIIEKSQLPQGRVDMIIDGAYTKNTQNDPTGIISLIYHENTAYVTMATSKWLGMPELLKFMPSFSASVNHDKGVVRIEPKASGHSIKQLLFDMNYNAVLIQGDIIKQSKEERADGSSPYMESGRIKLLKGPWNDEVLSQLAQFPNGKHDEYVDLFCYIVSEYMLRKKFKAFT